MTTYQDVVAANGAIGAWALTEASGTDFAPYIGGTHLTGQAPLVYQQPGPFPASFSLELQVGAFLHLPFLGTVLTPPVTTEAWFKMTTLTPSPYELLMRAGQTATNGTGFYMDSAAHIHWTAVGGVDIDTGFVWPDLNFHLLDWETGPNFLTQLYFDGQLIWQNTPSAPSGPSPNTIGFLSDAATDNAHANAFVALPAFYNSLLPISAVKANHLAATDPAAAIGGSLTGATFAATDILQWVRQTYQNAP